MMDRTSRPALPGGSGPRFPVDDSPIFKRVDFDQTTIRAALTRLRQAIIDEYSIVDQARVQALYGPFLSKLFAVLESKLLPIFTTNYDPAVEHFCEHSPDTKLTLINGFEFRRLGAQTRVWKRAVFDSCEPDSSRWNVALFKMHGSADWNREKISGEVRSGLPIYLENDRFENTVIYPATRKVAFEEPYSTAYDYFQRCCERAFLCVTIGYSFRDYDALTRLRSAARLNKHLQMLILDPNADRLATRLEGVSCLPAPRFFNRERAADYLAPVEQAVEQAMKAFRKQEQAKMHLI